MGSYNYTISIGHLGEQLTLNQWVLGSSPRWCTKVQPYGKRKAVFLLQFPGMLRIGAPSGTRTACCGGDRRLRREQGTGAGAAVAENKPRQGAPFDAVTASRDPAFRVPRGKNAPVGRF